MQKLPFLFFLLSILSSTTCFSQELSLKLKESLALNANTFFGIDAYGAFYYATDDNTFYKKTKDSIVTYTNYQLGEISTANVFNPLKVNLFYKDFNTVIVLDNRLAEISKVDFNTIQPYKNVSFISTGFSNTLWVFNQDKQLLELYDYVNNIIKVKTVPVQAKVLDLKSDYNYCYLLTEKYLYIYNYFGSLLERYKNDGYQSLALSKASFVLKKDQKLYILAKDTSKISPLKYSNLLINQFFVTNETLYIYDGKLLRCYQLKKE